MDSGLENVVAAETVLSDVDGHNGRLVIRGWPVEAMAASLAYEDGLHLLWKGFFADLPDVKSIGSRLGAARAAAFRLTADMKAGDDIVPALRTGWSRLQDDETLETAFLLAGSAAVLTAGSAPSCSSALVVEGRSAAAA